LVIFSISDCFPGHHLCYDNPGAHGVAWNRIAFRHFVPAILIAALVSGFPAGAFSTSNGPDRLAGISGAPLRIQSSHRYRL
jgi:hypothetical protein